MKNWKSVAALAVALGMLYPASAREYVGAHQRKNTAPDPSLAANCAPPSAATELNINQVRALIQTGGDMWWDLQGQSRYEVPKGSGHTALFAGALWMGGQDVSGQLKVAGQRFRGNTGIDYWTGPLSTITSEIDPQTCVKWDRHFVSTRDEVAQFVAYQAAQELVASGVDPNALDAFRDYQIPDFIINWPAHGNQAMGEDYYMAPFIDVNGDGTYNPLDGDFPGYDLKGEADCSKKISNIYGDQNLWWIFNDKGNVHTATGSAAIGMEIRAQAFAFATNDEVNLMTFYNYELINRSTFTLTETYFGQWVDGDLGNPLDDYVGCDVMRGLGYFYNGDNNDENASGAVGYGEQPPAIGVDFFQGPFQDNDGLDNPEGIGPNEALNGVGYGNGIVDDERFGMRRFLYHNRDATPTGDPTNGAEYYNYLRGIWRDGNPMTYGGTGYNPGDPNAVQADFMFPDDTDPLAWGTGGVQQAPWSEALEGNPPFDRRFIQSAGPFTLAPGAVNNITVGVAYARATSGGPFASVQALRRADDKTQALFDECFRVLNGPDAPDLAIQELDKELILSIVNLEISNNYNESYSEVDPFANVPDSVDVNGDDTLDIGLTDEEKERFATYKFQGYQVYQVKDASVSPSDLDNADLARLVFQCDIKDSISQMVNYYFDKELNANVPVEEVDGADEGISHSFKVVEDKFAQGDNRLVNHKTYYFMAISYASNYYGDDFGNLKFVEEEYDASDPDKLEGQKLPYLASRKRALGGIITFSGIPHKTEVENGGTILNAQYGDGVEITRIEGRGNGGNSLLMKPESLEEALTGAPWRVKHPTYEAGRGPVDIKVIDPLNVKGGDYTLAFKDDETIGDLSDGRWELTGGDLQGVIHSNQVINVENEQLIPELGISIRVKQQDLPGLLDNGRPSDNNGLIEADLVFENPGSAWLTGVPDQDDLTAQNWIFSGVSDPEDDPNTPNLEEDRFADIFRSIVLPLTDTSDTTIDFPEDPTELYESLLEGTWAPAKLASDYNHGPLTHPLLNLQNQMSRLQSVDVVFTSDRSKWTRVPVIEMAESEAQAEGGARKSYLRAARSVDKFGQPGNDGDLNPSDDPEHPNYISATGMGWFPGYAINIETGERLNMAFGEDSWLKAENGQDMLWNPTTQINEGPFQNLRFGGKHYIFVFRNNVVQDGDLTLDHSQMPEERMPAYDAGKFMHDQLASAANLPDLFPVYRAAMWIGLPLLADGFELLDNTATVRLRVNRPYAGYGTGEFVSPGDALVLGETYFVDKGPVIHDDATYQRGQHFVATQTDFTVPPTVVVDGISETNTETENNLVLSINSGLPLYNFNLDALAPTQGQKAVAEAMLGDIHVVPNPYYAYSTYEQNKNDNRVKVINLPQTCTVDIYTLNGVLVRSFRKDDPTITSIDWDLKNHAKIPIAGGVYIVHIQVPGVGEHTVKWFGAMRPIDLDSF